MYHVYNGILRNVESQEDAATANCYPTTIQLIVSGIRKLSAIAKMPEGGAVFRGLAGLALPPEFFAADAQGCAGGVEASFMSTTLSEEVARKYSGVHEGREATIFRLTLGKTSLGANKACALFNSELNAVLIDGSAFRELHQGFHAVTLHGVQRSKTANAALKPPHQTTTPGQSPDTSYPGSCVCHRG